MTSIELFRIGIKIRGSFELDVGYLLHEDVGYDVHSEEHPKERDEVQDGEKRSTKSGDARQKDPASNK